MLVIGITGGIGSGKSLVSEILRDEYDAAVIDTDMLAHELMRRGTPVYKKVVEEFGDKILDSSLEIDRKKLGGIVFGNSEKLRLLDEITHPAVEAEVDRRIAEFKKKGFYYTALETALLIEAGYEDKCDKIWYVHTDKPVRIKRLKTSRGMDEEKARRIISSQKTEEAFIKIADEVIDNTGSKYETKLKIDRILTGYRGR